MEKQQKYSWEYAVLTPALLQQNIHTTEGQGQRSSLITYILFLLYKSWFSELGEQFSI